MLLTRSPLSPGPKPWFSLDLHVLSAPPAFVLSQDQTLREEICLPSEEGKSDPIRALLARQRPEGRSRATNTQSPKSSSKGKEDGFIPLAGQSLRAVSTFHAVEFSKTAPALRQQKASDSAEALGDGTQRRIRSLEGRSLSN